MRNSDEKKPKFNYCFVISILCEIITGELAEHISFLNALACCKDFKDNEKRIFHPFEYSMKQRSYDMQHGINNAPPAMRDFFVTGMYHKKRYDIPSSGAFKKIVKGKLNFYPYGSEEIYKAKLLDCLKNGDNPHLSNELKERLIKCINTKDIYTIIFECTVAAIICCCNVPRKPSKTRNNKAYREALQATSGFSESKTTILEESVSDEQK